MNYDKYCYELYINHMSYMSRNGFFLGKYKIQNTTTIAKDLGVILSGKMYDGPN